MDLVNKVLKPAPDMAEALYAGDWKAFWARFRTALVDDTTFREVVQELLDAYLQKLDPTTFAGSGRDKFLKHFAKFLQALFWIDKAFAAGDIGTVAVDAARSRRGDTWEVRLFAPKVKLVPTKSRLSCGGEQSLKVDVKVTSGERVPTESLVYHFTATGQNGHLFDPNTYAQSDDFTCAGRQGCPGGTVKYTALLEPTEGTDTITVEAFIFVEETIGGNVKRVKQSVGKGTAKIEVGASCDDDTGYLGPLPVWRSWCAGAFAISPTVVKAGETITVTTQAGVGGACGSGHSIAVSHAVDVVEQTGVPGSPGLYSYCGWSIVPRPEGNMLEVFVADDQTHSFTFTIDPALECAVCVREDVGLGCGGSGVTAVHGPAVVQSGYGAWSSVGFFHIDPKDRE